MLRRRLLGSRPPRVPEKRSLGFFKQLCASVVLGELLNHMQALRVGDDSEYPLMVYVNTNGTVVTFPTFQKLRGYPSA